MPPAELNSPSPALLSVVIPVFNELRTWRELVRKVEEVTLPGLRKQIILVDDCSLDGTRQELMAFANEHAAGGEIEYRVLFHQRNQGKGAALRTGFDAATGDFVIVQDADLEYDPQDYPALLAPMMQEGAKVVYGSRFAQGRPPQAAAKTYLANRLLTLLSNWTTGLDLSDMETCYKAFTMDVLRQVHIEQDRFGFEPEITAKVAALGLKIREVPVRYAGRTKREGKKIGFKDGLDALRCIWRYRPRRG